MVGPGSTFGYVAHGLTGGRATLYGPTHISRDLIGPAGEDCAAVPTSEPHFHFLKHAVRAYASCRLGAANATRRGSELYRRSTVLH